MSGNPNLTKPGLAVELNAVSFRYPGAENLSLSDFSIAIKPGEFVVLTGSSGSGKTTITRLINGLIPLFYEGELTGEVRVAGIVPANNQLWELPVGSVFQNPRAQFFTTDTTSEIAFGCENLGLSVTETTTRVEAAIESLQLAALRDRSVFALSGGEKQRLACASVAAVQPQIYVLDEPSANLDAIATEHLQSIMNVWKQAGATVIVAEHRLGYIRELADRVVIIADGRLQTEYSGDIFRTLSEARLRELGLRSSKNHEITTQISDIGGPELVIEDLNFSYQRPGYGRETALHLDKLTIPKGKITAVVGSNGSGKTTLLNWLAGLKNCPEGRLRDGGALLKRSERLRRVFLVMQDVNLQLFTESVREEIEMTLWVADSKAERQSERALEILERLDLSDVSERHPMSLSVGQKQRVAIGVALASGREIIALDEPTSGLDLAHMESVAKALHELSQAQKTVILATHDADLVVYADNLIQLNKGQLLDSSLGKRF